MKTICINSNKGGVGKTTTAKNIAAVLSLQKKRVLLIDLDPQINCTKGIGIKSEDINYTIFDLFTNTQIQPDNAILPTNFANIDIIPGNKELISVQNGMANKASTPLGEAPIYELSRIIKQLKKTYDYIVIDTPPDISYMTVNALVISDHLIIPASASAYAEDGAKNTIVVAQLVRERYNENLKLIKLLVTRTKNTNASKCMIEDIQSQFNDSVLEAKIPESTVVDEAEQVRQPVVIYDEKSPASQAYIKVVEEITNG